MGRMSEYHLDRPLPDTNLEDCAYAQHERELRADPAFSEWLETLKKQRKEMKRGDQRI